MKGKRNNLTVELEAKAERKTKRRLPATLNRVEAFRDQIPTILIVCEGQNTEPSYFKQFQLASIRVKYVGEGYNTLSLVNRTLELSEQEDYEQVWCVFDKDDFRDFTAAIQRAQHLKFFVAYSNQAFEYWILLHFLDHQGGKMNRSDYNKRINKLLKPHNVHYDGNGKKLVSKELFDLMYDIDRTTRKPRITLAIERAKRNDQMHMDVDPAKAESSTTVYLLVEELLKYD